MSEDELRAFINETRSLLPSPEEARELDRRIARSWEKDENGLPVNRLQSEMRKQMICRSRKISHEEFDAEKAVMSEQYRDGEDLNLSPEATRAAADKLKNPNLADEEYGGPGLEEYIANLDKEDAAESSKHSSSKHSPNA